MPQYVVYFFNYSFSSDNMSIIPFIKIELYKNTKPPPVSGTMVGSVFNISGTFVMRFMLTVSIKPMFEPDKASLGDC